MEDNELKFSKEVVELIINATSISEALFEEEVSTLDIIMASFCFPFTDLYEFLLQEGEKTEELYPLSIITKLVTDKKLYKKIMGINYGEFVKSKKERVQELVSAEKQNTLVLSTKILYANFSAELERAFKRANKLAETNGEDCIQINLLIYSCLKDERSKAFKLIKSLFTIDGLIEYLEECINLDEENATKNTIPKKLRNYLFNMNEKISKEPKNDILGRDDEIFKVWNVFLKKTKRNAILVGEPGVGKTAIVEAITNSIVEKKCPKQFEDYVIYSLNLNSMVAGTKYRGEFEEKVNDFIKFLENTPNAIIFIDEIHQLLGAGATDESSPTFVGSLKTILARDNVIFIGATTTKEYKIFSSDGALARRFETIIVEEPKHNEVKSMIKKKVETLSKFHNVSITDQNLDEILVTARSFSTIANPDRTIDLIDKSMAIAKFMNETTLKSEHIRKVYKYNFDKLEKTPEDLKKQTAYHEAGHFAAWLLSKTKVNSKCTAVSIVPTEEWNGVTMYEYGEIINSKRGLEFLKESVSIALAGRISQKFVSNSIDAGASEDLKNATNEVEQYIMNYGMDKDYLNYSFSGTDDNLKISDTESDKIRKKTMDFVNEVYKETEKHLEENKKGIDNVANLLLEKYIITYDEAKEAFEKGTNKN